MNATVNADYPWPYAVSPPIPSIVYCISCVYLSIVGFVGTLANSFIIYAFKKIKRIQTPYNIVILNLIFTELLISAFGIPIDFVSSFNQGWKFGRVFCEFVGFLLTLLGICSVYTLTLLAFFRFSIFFRQNFSLTFKGSLISIASAWFCSVMISLPPLIGWGEYVPEKSGMSCAPKWEDSSSSSSYIISLFFFGFFIPVFIIVYCNCRLILILKKNTASMTVGSTRTVAKRHERNSTVILLIMTTSFFICWMPYTICTLYVVFGGDPPPWLSAIPLQFAKSSICVSPIIYAFSNSEFRTNVIKYFQRDIIVMERPSYFSTRRAGTITTDPISAE